MQEKNSSPAQSLDAAQRPIDVVREQANDEALWFVAETASESYLQDALRWLHTCVESEEDEIARLRAELEHHKAWATNRYEACERAEAALANPLLTGMNIGNGTLDIGLEGAGPQLIAGMFLGMFEKYPDAKNYIDVTFDSPQGPLLVTVVKPGGKTPHQARLEAEAERDALRADARRYRWLTADPVQWDEGECLAFILAHGDRTWRGQSLDDAIDAAMRGRERT